MIIVDSVPAKRCEKCGGSKALESFSRNKRRKDGLMARCKECERLRLAKWRADNPEKSRRYYASNTEKCKERNAQWKADNPEQATNHIFNHDARKRVISPELFVEEVDKFAIFRRDEWICHICTGPIPQGMGPDGRYHPHYPTVDHVFPLSKGGEHSYRNVKAAHRRCNEVKRS